MKPGREGRMFIFGNLFWLLLFLQEAVRQQAAHLHFVRLTPFEKIGVFVVLMASINFLFCLFHFGAKLSRARSPQFEKIARFLEGAGTLLALTPFFFLLVQPIHQLTARFFGSQNGPGRWRNVGTLIAAGAVYFLGRNLMEVAPRVAKNAMRGSLGIAIAGATLLMFAGVFSLKASMSSPLVDKNTFPNVLLLTPDGVEAAHTSLYGYSRDTTPFLRSLVSRGLLVSDSHAVGSGTYSSTAAMLSGRHPASTGLNWFPASLKKSERGRDFISELERLGYTKLVRRSRFTDLQFYGLGLQSMNPWPVVAVTESRTFASYTLDKVVEVFPERVKSFVMQNPLVKSLLTDQSYLISDEPIVADFMSRLLAMKRPFFAHLHLMNTHCCTYHVKKRYFEPSNDLSPTHPQGYDDAIREADLQIEKIVKSLEEKSLLENTLVIITSDHSSGAERDNGETVPLLFLFPRGEHRGTVNRLASTLDIAPTVLDYLRVEIPSWMRGYSLLRPSEIPKDRSLLGVWRHHNEFERLNQKRELSHPFFGLEKWTLASCQTLYSMDPETEAVEKVRALERSSTTECSDPSDRTPASLAERFRKELNHFR